MIEVNLSDHYAVKDYVEKETNEHAALVRRLIRAFPNGR